MPALALGLGLVPVLVLVMMLVHVVALWPCGSGAGLTRCLGNCTMRTASTVTTGPIRKCQA
jgi:hypothetical protein